MAKYTLSLEGQDVKTVLTALEMRQMACASEASRRLPENTKKSFAAQAETWSRIIDDLYAQLESQLADERDVVRATLRRTLAAMETEEA